MAEANVVTPVAGADRTLAARGERFYHPELDILRFTAFLLVFFWHILPQAPQTYRHLGFSAAGAQNVVDGLRTGAFGVDLFFALSSYLITELLLREYRSRGRIDVGAFYKRRMLRIWPLYFVFLLLAPPVMRALGHVDEPGLKWTLCFALLIGNWACVWWGFPTSATGPLWSVSIEEQFYLVWPLVMSRWIRHIRPIAWGLLACGFAARAWSIPRGGPYTAVWCNTFCRLDPIAGGILLASYLNGRVPRFGGLQRIGLTVAGLAMMTFAGLYGGFSGVSSLAGYPAAAAGSVLLVLGTLAPMSDSRPGPIRQMFIHLGRISYGLYVFHVGVMTIVNEPSSSASRWAINIGGSLLGTVALAAISYRWLETPFLRLKDKLAFVRSAPVEA